MAVFETMNADWWRANAVAHAIPEKNPEGWDVVGFVGDMLKDERLVVDYGCGTGRFARGFSPKNYLGFDISDTAIEEASSRVPDYQFGQISRVKTAGGWGGAAILLYTVLLHVTDEELSGFLSSVMQFNPSRIVVGEITGRKWRKEPHAFNREIWEYRTAFADCGFWNFGYACKPYFRYGRDDCPLTIMNIRR